MRPIELSCFLLPIVSSLLPLPLLAQIVPDSTLPINSAVTQDGQIFIIDGGSQAGGNLFHSFEQFSIFSGEVAIFNNSPTIETIFTRVTGGIPSTIDGTIEANGFANLFLLNPSGILFGPNATLNLGGSFFATTADRIQFADGFQFSAATPQVAPLLTVSVPVGLGFGQTPGSIVNRSQASPGGFTNSVGEPIGLAVLPERTLALVGGDISLENGSLTAFGGRIELGSVADSGTVGIAQTSTGFSLSYTEIATFGDIQLADQSIVDASGRPPFILSPDDPGGGGGAIQVRANQLDIVNSAITSTTFGEVGGDLSVTANVIELSGALSTQAGFLPAGLFSQTETTGGAGNLSVTAERLTVRDGAQISTGTFGSGDGGTLTVIADSINLSGTSGTSIQDFPSGLTSEVIPLPGSPFPPTGTAGDIFIETRSLSLRDGAAISASTSGFGNSGEISIRASELVSIEGGALIRGFQPSNISVQASPSFSQTGEFQVAPDRLGAAGSIRIETGQLTIRDAAQINALTASAQPAGSILIEADRIDLSSGGQILSNTIGTGLGGSVIVRADEVVLTGTAAATGVPSGLFTQTQGLAAPVNAGDGGNLTVEVERLTLQDGAAISADTFADGRGGDVNITADDFIRVIGRTAVPTSTTFPFPLDSDGFLPSRITAQTVGGSGTAGSVTLTTDSLSVLNEGRVSVDTSSLTTSADAGNLMVNAEEIELQERGALTGETSSGQGGSIFLVSDDIQLLDNSRISTTAGTAGNPGDGGNITIDTDLLIGLNNSDITSNAFNGSGGRIEVTAEGIFGLEERGRSQLEAAFGEDLTNFDAQNLDTNDVTAISLTSPDLSGTVDFNTPDVDPARGLVELAENFAEAPIDRNPCIEGEGSEFVNTRRGGLPPTPDAPFTGDATWEDWRLSELDGGGEPIAPTEVPPQATSDPLADPFLEAQDWRVGEAGELILFAPDLPSPIKGAGSPQNGCAPRIPAESDIESDVESGKSDRTTDTNITNTEPTYRVEGFEVTGSTAFTPEELARVTATFAQRELTFNQLLQASTNVTQLYTDAGYITSAAYIPEQVSRDRVVKIQVVEGQLEDIQVYTEGRLNPGYVRRRLARAVGTPVNQNDLVEALQLLQLDDRIETIAAELSQGVRRDRSLLTVRVREASLLDMQLRADNGRAPSVGTVRRGGQVDVVSPLGWGDVFSVAYTNTTGSDDFSVGYAVPVNARNGTVGFTYGEAFSEITEEPFDRADIDGRYRFYEFTYRQPLLQTIRPKAIAEASPSGAVQSELLFREFALGFTFSRQESNTSILDVDFPLSPGANDDGETRITALRFSQDWVQRDNSEVLALRSEFSLGVDWFDATDNDDDPDSQFFAWRGQGQWVRRLGGNTSNTLLVVRGDVQLSTDPLVPLEQFSVGGLNSVRGYRQDARLTDNGALISAEVRVPVLRLWRSGGLLQIAPFFDAGVAWNRDGDAPTPNALASVGIGLRLRLSERLGLNFDWGIPLVDVDSGDDDTWQEDGLYFSIESSLF